MRTTKGITRPEMIVAVAVLIAHAAVYKASRVLEYFDITLGVCQSSAAAFSVLSHDVAATPAGSEPQHHPHLHFRARLSTRLDRSDFGAGRFRAATRNLPARRCVFGGFVLPFVPKPGTNLGPCSGLISSVRFSRPRCDIHVS